MVDRNDSSDLLLIHCLSQIESSIGWGRASEWSTKDFDSLGERIFLKSGVRLSAVTLKRMWGTIRYDSKPTITTLNALAQFLDFENWQVYKQSIKISGIDHSHGMQEARVALWRRPIFTWLLVILALIPLVSILYLSASLPVQIQTDKSKYSFSSHKVVDIGVPNTVVFDYDASAAAVVDTVAIQQSWDKRLSTVVDQRLKQHTSIYYRPGYFDARLTVNGTTVKQHELLIRSEGWLPLIDVSPVPVYFTQEDIMHDGFMTLPIEKVQPTLSGFQPQIPWLAFYNVSDFGDFNTDDFVFETRIKNDFNTGTAICRNTEVHILFEGGAMVIPLSIPGCVSELNLGLMSGKTTDLSAFGADLSQWTDVKFQVEGPLATILINNKKAFDFKPALSNAKWVGMIFKFQGVGSVDFVKVSRKKDAVVYQENFDRPATETKQLH